jgi:hypothetical protein
MSWQYFWEWWCVQPEIIARDERRRAELEAEAKHLQWEIEKTKNRIQQREERMGHSLSRRLVQGMRQCAGLTLQDYRELNR